MKDVMMTLLEAMDYFIIACKAEGLAPRTVEWYECRLGPFIGKHGTKHLSDITRHHIRAYIVELQERDNRYKGNHPYKQTIDGGLSPNTIRGHVRAIRRLFSWLVEEGYIEIEANPMLGIKLPSLPKQEPKGIDLEDLRKLIAATEGEDPTMKRDRAVVLFLADTGCRLGGLLNLKVDDIDFERNVAIVFEKGAKTRPVPFTAATAEALKHWLEVRPTDRGNNVFVSMTYPAPLTNSGVRQLLLRLKQRSGAKGRVNPHAFRHGFARQYLLNGGDLGTLADLMGHSDVKVTKDYYAVYTTEELARQHKKYSPITHLYDGE
jgi:site-specific recombinase XerD